LQYVAKQAQIRKPGITVGRLVGENTPVVDKERTMSKKKLLNPKRLPKKANAAESAPAFDRRGMDKVMTDLGRLLESQEFDSPDEINAYLQQIMASGQPIPAAAPRTPLEEAQDLMYEAFDASGKRRIDLAKEALTISPDCADAYVLLAEESASSLTEARDLYAMAVAAGERALGAETFAEAAGHFWGVVETRPYMRARAGLAGCLWQMGQHEEAIGHYEEMLRLNPGDNQGIRYVLLNAYLMADQEAAAERLLGEYTDDGSATWLYNHALALYRREKESEKARASLQEALQQNSHVPAYLLGRKRLPRRLPTYTGFGDDSEAVYYAAEAGRLWSETEGALDWLRRAVAEL
jgi:tetratricopeptide (TPR) repeat protein